MKVNYLLVIFAFLFFSCGEKSVILPKPRMYPRIIYPDKVDNVRFDTSICDFTFSYPKYAKIIQDSINNRPNEDHPCWFDVYVPSLNASLHCSYVKLSNKNEISKVINDAFKIVDEHNIKANYRKEDLINTKNGIEGVMFSIDGPVASPKQFYLTDNKNHFFRASLYFNAKVDPDSTAPVLHFLNTEIDSLISTFKWK